jgi:uncharacterized protein YjbI with pentapeptide repeats
MTLNVFGDAHDVLFGFSLLALVALVALFVAVAESHVSFLRPWLRTTRDLRLEGRLAARRRELAAILSDLWSNELNARLAAVAALAATADVQTEPALGGILAAFVRYRLANEPAASRVQGANLDDVKMALETLASQSVQQALRTANQKVDLSGVDFSHATLAGANFSGYRLARAKFDGCYLAEATFTSADLTSASFVSANISSAKFVGSNLSNVDMGGADLSNAVLTRANLKDTNVSGAILIGVSGLDQEQLDEAFGDDETAVPQQFKLATIGLRRPIALTSSTVDAE